eukprot:CAMPEP_0113548110 /NCGR_PEP_ID=MMETSP0015_2-20120614/12718_1 /TAXON_ID=2838 /ORGANISM="Odontella" /LENGTH=194 /DNA_ID=CAMNT_0000448717 /DNA_START=143 /DNA_END=723 /DNA_ORIENTATION=+ /assembly_acc=CAM_ASM_000160
MRTGVDGHEERRPLAPGGSSPQMPPITGGALPPNHWFYKVKRACIAVLSAYGLHELGAWHAVFRAPDVRHEWFKVGLAASIAILAIKLYIELFCGKMHGKRRELRQLPPLDTRIDPSDFDCNSLLSRCPLATLRRCKDHAGAYNIWLRLAHSVVSLVADVRTKRAGRGDNDLFLAAISIGEAGFGGQGPLESVW